MIKVVPTAPLARRQRRAQPFGRTARRTPGHIPQNPQIRTAHTARRPGARGAVILGSDCPAHGHRVKIAFGVAVRSASLNLDPAPAHKGIGACENDAPDQ